MNSRMATIHSTSMMRTTRRMAMKAQTLPVSCPTHLATGKHFQNDLEGGAVGQVAAGQGRNRPAANRARAAELETVWTRSWRRSNINITNLPSSFGSVLLYSPPLMQLHPLCPLCVVALKAAISGGSSKLLGTIPGRNRGASQDGGRRIPAGWNESNQDAFVILEYRGE